MGLELIRTVFKKQPHPVRVIRLDRIPGSLTEIVESGNRECHSTFKLWILLLTAVSPPPWRICLYLRLGRAISALELPEQSIFG